MTVVAMVETGVMMRVVTENRCKGNIDLFFCVSFTVPYSSALVCFMLLQLSLFLVGETWTLSLMQHAEISLQSFQ